MSPTNKSRHFLYFYVFRWTLPFELSHFYQQAAYFLLCFQNLNSTWLFSFFPSFLSFLWSWNLLSAKSSAETPLKTDSIILAVQYHTLSAGFITSGSPPPCFLLFASSSCCTASGVCNLPGTPSFFSCLHFVSSVGLYADTVAGDTVNRTRCHNAFIPPDNRSETIKKVSGKKTLYFFLFSWVYLLPLSKPFLVLSLLKFPFLTCNFPPPPSFFSSAKLAGKGFSEALVSAPLSGLAMAS